MPQRKDLPQDLRFLRPPVVSARKLGLLGVEEMNAKTGKNRKKRRKEECFDVDRSTPRAQAGTLQPFLAAHDVKEAWYRGVSLHGSLACAEWSEVQVDGASNRPQQT